MSAILTSKIFSSCKYFAYSGINLYKYSFSFSNPIQQDLSIILKFNTNSIEKFCNYFVKMRLAIKKKNKPIESLVHANCEILFSLILKVTKKNMWLFI
jgi:hypothetical protein